MDALICMLTANAALRLVFKRERYHEGAMGIIIGQDCWALHPVPPPKLYRDVDVTRRRSCSFTGEGPGRDVQLLEL
jgi:hypothetical protein